MRYAQVLVLGVAFSISTAGAQKPAVRAAPPGDAKTVASRIIKENFPKCKRVTAASRTPDGSIRATCDGVNYLVFTVSNAKDGRTAELAMNCTAAKQLLNITC